MRRCRARDEDAWKALLDRYAGLIYSIPLRRGLGRDAADEIFQSVAATLVERLARAAGLAPEDLVFCYEREAVLEQTKAPSDVPLHEDRAHLALGGGRPKIIPRRAHTPTNHNAIATEHPLEAVELCFLSAGDDHDRAQRAPLPHGGGEWAQRLLIAARQGQGA